MPRIVLDGHYFATPWTGTAYYAFGLMQALAADARMRDLSVSVGMRTEDLSQWLASQGERGSPPEGSNVLPPLHRLIHRIPGLRGVARRARSLLHRVPAARLKCDLFHALNFVPITAVDAPLLPVLHDMSCFTRAQDHPAERVAFFERELPRVLAAPAVQTVSQFSKDEIVRLLGLPRDRVHVVRAGPDPECLAAPLAAPADRAPLGLDSGGYVTSISTLEPRKNLRTLVAAQLLLPPAVARRQPLVIAGANGWGDLRWPAGLDAAVADGRIVMAGYQDRATIVALMRHARALTYPSLYEGFGLPVLEALACGTEVLVTEGTACVEAGGGAAQTLPGLDASAWAEALRALADEPITPARRAALRTVALGQPDWPLAARQTYRLYEQLTGSGTAEDAQAA
jgi:glycosyltransferase involved in cell wall biosynthesis